MVWKIVLLGLLCLIYGSVAGLLIDVANPVQAEFASKQLDDVSFQQINMMNKAVQVLYGAGWLLIATIVFFTLRPEFKKMLQKVGIAGLIVMCLFSTGCWRPYQVPMLEQIDTQEEGFLIPLTGDGANQSSSNNEEFLKKNREKKKSS